MTNNKNMEKGTLGYFILLMFSPIISVILSAINAIKNNRYNSLLLFAVILAFYASGINITKTPISDQENYLEQFYNVGNLGFINTLIYGGNGSIREPIYGIYVYISYYLFMGNAKLFFLLTSFLILLFHYLTIINITKKYKYPNYIIITGIVLLTFFVPFFSLTLHLVRQELATAIALYAISLRAIDHKAYKQYIPYMIIALFTHSTSILMLLLSFLPGMNKNLTYKRLVYLILVTATITLTFPRISQSILGGSDTNFVTYAMTRASSAEGLSDNASGTGMNKTILYIIATPLILLSLKSYITKREEVPPMISNLCLMMCTFVCLVSYSPLIQYRYFFVLYSFLILIPILIFKKPNRNSKVSCFIISIAIIIFFLTSYDKNYQYAELVEIICYPYPLYFTITPY